jgi:hypothetical protein
LSQEDWEQNRAEGFRYCAIVEQEAIAALAAVWTYSPTHWEVAAVSTAPAFRKMGYGKTVVCSMACWDATPTNPGSCFLFSPSSLQAGMVNCG